MVGTPTTEAVYTVAVETGVPIIGPYSGAQSLRNPFKVGRMMGWTNFYLSFDIYIYYIIFCVLQLFVSCITIDLILILSLFLFEDLFILCIWNAHSIYWFKSNHFVRNRPFCQWYDLRLPYHHQENIINMRISYYDELVSLITFARDRMGVSRFGVVYVDNSYGGNWRISYSKYSNGVLSDLGHWNMLGKGGWE